MRARVLLLALLLPGCSGIWVTAMESNYITFEQPFTDAADAEVQRRAELSCKQRGQVAVRTEHVCSLSKCFTSYQCVDKAGAATSSR